MIDHLPMSLRGLMMAGFLAAYMSTIGTHLNLGASYLTNDLYRRFVNRDASDAHYVVVSRIATVVVMFLAAIGAFTMTSVGDAWKYLFNLTAGVGLVMILRWYWWRVNAWSEISALIASAVVSNALLVFNVFTGPNATAQILLVTVPATTVVWLFVTFVTKPDEQSTLVRFFERVRPSPLGWGPVARLASVGAGEESLGLNAIDWIAGCGLVYGTLFGIGKLVLGDLTQGLIYLAVALACGATITYNIVRTSEPDLPETIEAA
jgi:Na+/proline symporter